MTCSPRFPRRVAVVLAAAVLIFALRAIPAATTATADASVCDWPVLSLACDVIGGVIDGVRVEVSTVSGAVKDVASGKVIALASRFGCQATVTAEKEGIGATAIQHICQRVVGWLSGKVLKTATGSSPPTTSTAPAGGGSNGAPPGGNGTNGSAAGSGDPASGTPAAALSTGAMAALGATATLFVASYISSDTKANLTSGWFQSMYTTVESYAWLLAAIVIAFAAAHVMLTSWSGKLGGYGVLLARVPYAAILMVGVPVLTMAALAIVDALCGDVMATFPDGKHLLRALAVVLAILGGTSNVASALGHSTIAHVTGAGAWFLAGWMLITSGAIALELLVREVAIYLTVLVVPLALIGEIFPPFARWATGLLKALFVVVVAKLFLVLGLAVAGTVVGAGLSLTSFSPVDVIVGVVALGLIALFPALIYGALIRVEAAWHTGAGQNIASAPGHVMTQHVRAAYARVQGGLNPEQARDMSQAQRTASLIRSVDRNTAMVAAAHGIDPNGNGHGGEPPIRPVEAGADA